MFNFLKNLFNLFMAPEKRGLGAEVNPLDRRDIMLATFQAPVELPYEYETDISMLPVMDQKAHGSCVGQAEGLIIAYFDCLENKNNDVSRRHIYARAKKEDGIPDIQGTYPRVAASIIADRGVTTSKLVADNNDLLYNDYVSVIDTDTILKEARARKANYAFVAREINAIKQAIYQNKLVSITLFVDWDSWRKTRLKKPVKLSGGHRVVLYGWVGNYFQFRNSWGEKWGDDGNGEFFFDDYVGYMEDALCYTDVPNEILEEAQNKPFTFTKTMRYGDRGFEIKQLQERLGIIPTDGIFGLYTKKKVIEFQLSRGLVGDGVAGKMTLTELNKKQSKIDLWCEGIKMHEGWYPGSRSYRNKNPGNLKYVGQARTVGKDAGGFCIFGSYADGLQELKDLLIRAATPPDNGRYRPEMSLLQFFQVYAPASDNNHPENYARNVAQRIGVEVDEKISNLI